MTKIQLFRFNSCTVAITATLVFVILASQSRSTSANDLVSMNKRSAMLLDRLMYNLKEIMKKQPGKDDSGSNESSMQPRFDRRAYRYVRGKVYTKCYMNAVSCF